MIPSVSEMPGKGELLRALEGVCLADKGCSSISGTAAVAAAIRLITVLDVPAYDRLVRRIEQPWRKGHHLRKQAGGDS